MNDPQDALIEQVSGAFRGTGLSGEVQAHRAFYDLDEAGRLEAHQRSIVLRQLESALDPRGFSTTVRSVLNRIADSTR